MSKMLLSKQKNMLNFIFENKALINSILHSDQACLVDLFGLTLNTLSKLNLSSEGSLIFREHCPQLFDELFMLANPVTVNHVLTLFKGNPDPSRTQLFEVGVKLLLFGMLTNADTTILTEIFRRLDLENGPLKDLLVGPDTPKMKLFDTTWLEVLRSAGIDFKFDHFFIKYSACQLSKSEMATPSIHLSSEFLSHFYQSIPNQTQTTGFRF